MFYVANTEKCRKRKFVFLSSLRTPGLYLLLKALDLFLLLEDPGFLTNQLKNRLSQYHNKNK